MCAFALQVLIYPKVTVIDECSLKSYQEYKDGPVIDQRSIDWSVLMIFTEAGRTVCHKRICNGRVSVCPFVCPIDR